jgi:hypothetical protein
VGGGGGNGGYAISLSGGATYGSLGLALGGDGGAGNKGGNVGVASTTDIATNGAFSSAIAAHSIGGGGGNGGFTIAGAGSIGAGLALSFGGGGGAGADAGTVNVTSVGNLTTGQPGSGAASALSNGIFAESVGGSGGSGGFTISGSGPLLPCRQSLTDPTENYSNAVFAARFGASTVRPIPVDEARWKHLMKYD